MIPVYRYNLTFQKDSPDENLCSTNEVRKYTKQPAEISTSLQYI